MTPAAECLLARRAGSFELGAELGAAIRPLPLPAADLDPALKQSESVELLSGWGRYGNGGAQLALASFTTHGPAASAMALIMTDRGLALRAPSGVPAPPRSELSIEAALTELARTPAQLVFVAAEAGVALATLHELLAALEARALPVALAVNLSTDTRLPPPGGGQARAARCDDGLPATAAADGELDPSELARGLAPLKEQLAACLTRGDARGAAGGQLTLAFRINEGGQVQDACIARDDIGDPGVAACVTEVARTLRFAPPAPSGVLDIELPLSLRQPPSAAQRPTCPP